MNLWSVLNWANAILLEGFKDDILNGYKKLGYDTEDKKLLSAIKAVNSQNEIKELVKKEVGKVPNVGLAVAKKYTPEEFIDIVSKAQQHINIKQQQQREKQDRKQKASSASEDYFIYTCRTFEEAHEAAFAHTGNLKRLSREDREKFFKDEYGIKIPEPSTHYQTDMTPEQMLEFMKECPVFMEPTWCVCADKKFWNMYSLEASKDEGANCFVVISKTHPNVRFCITISNDNRGFIEGDYVILKKNLNEFRDIWQIGGEDTHKVGTKMAELAFGDISGLLNTVLKKGKKVILEEITDGSEMFRENKEMTSFNKKLTSLDNGVRMFSCCSNLTSFTSELPSLTDGSAMFYGCSKLTTFTSDLPKLTNGYGMFHDCSNLTSFTSELPKLTDGRYMFNYCSNLTSFTSNLPSLTDGYQMFYGCSKLTTFTSDLPKLTDCSYMFQDCPNLTTFTSELPKLTDGYQMFGGCKLDKPSVINILNSIPARHRWDSSTITIGTGYDYTKDKDTLRAIEKAKKKEWEVKIKYNC